MSADTTIENDQNPLAVWLRSSGLSPAVESIASATITSALPLTTIVCAVTAFLGATAHILFLEPGLRPFLLPVHACFIGLGLYWRIRAPSHPNAAAALIGAYLSSVISIYVISGQFISTVHLGVLVVGGMYLALDRRLLSALIGTWAIWLTAIAVVWVPRGEGLPVLIICLISVAGGYALRRMRLSSIEEIVSLTTRLERTIGEREHALRRAQDAEKMESLGVMAAGVAHDYNNLLVGIVGGAELAANTSSRAERATALEAIRSSAASLTSLSAQLLEVSGGRPINKQSADLNAIIRRTVATLSSGDTGPSRIQLELDPNLPGVFCEPESIQQVVLNLLTNALEVSSSAPGAIAIGTKTEKPQTNGHEPDAIFWIVDDGPGVPEGLRTRIFDPFFTTNDLGRGLGLATTRSIVYRHGGDLRLTSQQTGACFEVQLPGTSSAIALPEPSDQGNNEPLAARPLLLVDDDELVRDVTARMMNRLGFKVVQAQSGEHALALIRDHQLSPALAVIDASMPGLDGPETIRRVRKLKPQLPIILYSGYHYAANQERHLPEDVHFLAKPFNTKQLKVALTTVAPELTELA